MKSTTDIMIQKMDKDLKAWKDWEEPKWSLPNFTMDEVRCPCCGRQNMNFDTISRFQKARDILGLPIYGNSWCRCVFHNKEIKGTWGSSHIIEPDRRCYAGDVTIVSPAESLVRAAVGMLGMTGPEFYMLHDALKQAGFTRFGLSVDFLYIHADDDDKKLQKTMWFYK